MAFAWGLAAPDAALAHGLIAGEEAPVPFWLVAIGAVLLLLVSFAAMRVRWHQPRFEQDRWKPLSGPIARAVVSPAASAVAGILGVVLLALVIATGLDGRSFFAPTFVFVTFWLGLTVASVLCGDVFRALNPWLALARAGGWLLRATSGRTIGQPLRYPEWLGRWPAALGLIGFVWLELNYALGAGLPEAQDLPSAGAPPSAVGLAAVFYTCYTFVGMATFGAETWLRRCEVFSVYFGMFASLSPWEVRDGRLGRRPWLAASTRWAAGVPGSIAIVIAVIALTIFDGARDHALAGLWTNIWESLTAAGVGYDAAARITSTLVMALVIAVVALVIGLGLAGMRRTSGGPSLARLGNLFAHTFVPIALGYLIAHYFSFFIHQEQAQFTYLLSDPFARGWNLFGTGGHSIDYGVVSDGAIWSVQLVALLTGHCLALVLAHDRALVVYGSSRRAARSQRWMLGSMVVLTLFALGLVSELS